MSDLSCAIALFRSERFADALPLFHAALRRSEQQPDGPSSKETTDILDYIGDCYAMLNDVQTTAEYFRRTAARSSANFESRIRASRNAASAFLTMDKFADAETQLNITLSMIDAQAAAGTTVPAALKGHRAKALSILADWPLF